MATFLQGVSDRFGDIQLYRPDYQFLTQVYGTRQAEYDRGFNAVRSLYNSILNGPLTNSDNQTFRQEAFKKLQGSLKSVSNVDLSNPVNISRAQSLVDPIAKDSDVAYDMAVTRFHQKQKQIMEQYKNSTDPKMRALYSDFSRMDIAFAEEDLRSAKRGDGSIQQVQPREFTPFEDVNEYLRKAAKEQGLEITQAGPDGRGYIIKRVNGIGAAPIFAEWAKGVLGNRFDRQFQVMGRVQAEAAVRNEMSQSGISRQEAINRIAAKIYPTVSQKESEKGVELDSTLKKMNDDIELIESKYPNGFPPSKADVKQQYQDLIRKRDEYNASLESQKDEVSRLQTEGPAYLASNLYNFFTREAKDNTAKIFGQSYATAKQSIEYRPDSTWATKARIASQERMFAQKMNWEQQKFGAQMAWDKYKFGVTTDLAIAKLKAEGKLPSEEMLGYGMSDKPAFGADILTGAMRDAKSKSYDAMFNVDNGLAKLVLNENPEKFSQLYHAMTKVRQMSEGANVKLTEQDQAAIKDYAGRIGLNLNRAITKQNAGATLDVLSSSTYEAGVKKIESYSKIGKSKDAAKYYQTFNQAAAAFQTITSQRESIDKQMQKISSEVLDANGNIKPLYKGAVIKGRLPNGGYDIDLTGVSTAAKNNLSNLISSEFTSRERPVTTRYRFSKMTGAEVDALITNPYLISSISSNNETISIDKLRNLNATDVQKLFGNQFETHYDAVNKHVKVKLNVSQDGDLAKKLGIKDVGTITLTIPYASIQASGGALSRMGKYIGANSIQNQSVGVLGDFMTNPYAQVYGESFYAAGDFDYSVTGAHNSKGQNVLMLNYKYKDPRTNKIVNGEETIPYTPGDVNSLLKANQTIQTLVSGYVNMREVYEED